MSASDLTALTRIKALPIRARVAFALALAQRVVLELADKPEALRMSNEALAAAWRWVGGDAIKGEEIGDYIDGAKYLGKHETMTRAAAAVPMQAVAYAGRQAHNAEGSEDMSETLWEVDEDLLDRMLDLTRETSSYDEAAIQRVTRFLVDRYPGQGPDVLGAPLKAEEILPLIFRDPAAK